MWLTSLTLNRASACDKFLNVTLTLSDEVVKEGVVDAVRVPVRVVGGVVREGN